MSVINSPYFLRTILSLDAATCLLSGPILMAFGPSLSPMIGLSASFLVITGAILFAFGAFIAVVASRPVVPRGAVLAIVVLNVIWSIDSLLLVASGWWPLSSQGQFLVIAQAFAGFAVAALEYIGWRHQPVLEVHA